MAKKTHIINVILAVMVIFLMIAGIILPPAIADSSKIYVDGFERGVSWKPYIPLKRATFVQLDEEGYTDDYAYLAAIPTTVFYDKNSDQIFSNPLLFYQDEYFPEEEKERTLNAYQGIEYFMEDWMSYCKGYLYLDQMTLINVPKSKLESKWKAKNYATIEGTDPCHIASQLALHDWSYSENAVIAVIEEKPDEKPDNRTEETRKGSIPYKKILTENFKVRQTNEKYPIYNEFDVPEGYKYIKVRSWYPCFYIDVGAPGFEAIVNMSIPAGDRDLQVYCDYNGQWMMAGISSAWNAKSGMDIDKTSAYVYNSGKWSVALTDVPTKSILLDSLIPSKDTKDSGFEVQKHRSGLFFGFGRYGRILDVLKNMRQVTYQIDVEIYPGVTIELPEIPPFGCRNASFELTWDDPSIKLGFSLIGPGGEEVLSTREPGVSSKCSFPGSSEEVAVPKGTENDMRVERLGECFPGEKYSICVFAMNEIKTSTDFTIEYSWEQNVTRKEGDCLASATEGAVLASLLNAPLLYTSSSETSSYTIDALYKLGVKKIYLLDLGNYLSSNAKDQLKSTATIEQHFTEYGGIYEHIRMITGSNDVIFSTIDPFSYWYVGDLEVAGEKPGSLCIGPAAYLAAHHGSPVLLIDNHPELSAAVVWHNELWRRHPDGYTRLPTVSEMYLTGTRVYDFLKRHGFDEEGEETIITLGGQFDIGLPWDRVFVGKGKPGRFIGSPTDISVWVSKTVFYPQIVFENPALKNPVGYKLINGSSSKRRPILSRGKIGLKITKPSQEETFKYPVLDTLICYNHKFNSRASKYWGFTYGCADGDIPGETSSEERIDDGVMVAVNGEEGAFLADMSGSEVQPFYLRKAGYDPVFSTNFEANMHNLNQGVLLWLINTHGGPIDGGILMFWDVKAENPAGGYPPIPIAGYNKEPNPWRGYEWLMGSTEEPDTMTMEIHGILPALAGNPNPRGLRIFTTALDWAAARRPARDLIGKIANLPILRFFAPEWLKDTEDYYDGVIITVLVGRFGTSWYNGTQVDDAIGNIHSAGVSSVACLPAGKYLHLVMMRHGSVFQIMDPWATSWYSDIWQNGVPRGIALGQTIGEIYSEGISKVGILYISEPPQWWWDQAENVCLYGDPDLRIWVPSVEYDPTSSNHWSSADVESVSYDEEFYVDGHNPFGAESYPNAREPMSLLEQLMWIVLIVAIPTLAIIGGIALAKKKR
ncbi:MAG: hypothetical protein JSW60_04955 [Thermoplasmatales archaeon]|nr:MAG: hypothetical protein JSW60_04955 [Thermoplasmatales archaeon]